MCWQRLFVAAGVHGLNVARLQAARFSPPPLRCWQQTVLFYLRWAYVARSMNAEETQLRYEDRAFSAPLRSLCLQRRRARRANVGAHARYAGDESGAMRWIWL